MNPLNPTAVVYVCPYCGTHQDEPNAACCHEQGHCEPRQLFIDLEGYQLQAECEQLTAALSNLEYKDYLTGSDKAWRAITQLKVKHMRQEIAFRVGVAA